MKLFVGSSVVILHWIAAPLGLIESWDGIPISLESKLYPSAINIWLCTKSIPVTNSVTVCSTWILGFISIK